jgi:3',5'-cyclic AMP phosphodiesterase CpdA
LNTHEPLTTLVHVTDAHITRSTRRTATLKHRSVEIVDDLLPQIEALSPEAVIFGGDNIDNRERGEEDLALFAERLERVRRPLVVAGNHEAPARAQRSVSKSAFLERMARWTNYPELGCFSESFGDVRVIGIDTTLEGTTGGFVAPATMAFLANALRTAEESHIVVVGHHPLHPVWFPRRIEAWDRAYLVANREMVVALLASCARVRVYLCGHHHGSRVDRLASRGHSGGFYQILSPSASAFPHGARVLRFGPNGLQLDRIRPTIPGLLDEGARAVVTGGKAALFARFGSASDVLPYVRGRSIDNQVFLPYHAAPRSHRIASGVLAVSEAR